MITKSRNKSLLLKIILICVISHYIITELAKLSSKIKHEMIVKYVCDMNYLGTVNIGKSTLHKYGTYVFTFVCTLLYLALFVYLVLRA